MTAGERLTDTNVVVRLYVLLDAQKHGSGGDHMGSIGHLKPKDAAATKEFVQQVRTRLQAHVLDLKLFGSKVTGHDVEESDIDVLVVVDQKTPELEDQVLDIAFDVNVAHDVYISPRVIGKAILDDPVWQMTAFLRHIAAEGVPL